MILKSYHVYECIERPVIQDEVPTEPASEDTPFLSMP